MELDINVWLNLVIRWFHIMAAILWIGTSFFFIWLDNHLQFEPAGGKGHVGKAWLFHSGGYYQIDKALVAPESVLSSLHWFKWEAYLTWLSGFALLLVVYYWHADAYLIDPSVADLSVAQAVAIGLGTLVVGWLVYDMLWRLLGRRSPGAATVISLILYVVAAYVLTHLLSGRAAYIHSGAMLGTIMAANVLFVIQPNQRKMYAANTRGETPDPALSHQSKQRSTHNNYLTLPVIFMMISNHYPMTYGYAANGLILVGLFFAGMGVDHYLNTRDTAYKPWGYAAVGGALAVVVAMGYFSALPTSMPAAASPPVATTDGMHDSMTAQGGMHDMSDGMHGHAATDDGMQAAPADTHHHMATSGETDGAAAGRVPFARAREIINARCLPCHSAHPVSPLFNSAPLGFEFDTPQEIRQLAPRIKKLAVDTRTMPLGNRTGMTNEERRILGEWIDQGANIPAASGQP